jgi:hypothetical protein
MHYGKNDMWNFNCGFLGQNIIKEHFISIIISEQGGGVCMYEYPYYVATLH